MRQLSHAENPQPVSAASGSLIARSSQAQRRGPPRGRAREPPQRASGNEKTPQQRGFRHVRPIRAQTAATARVSDWLEARSRRRAVKRWAAASDHELRAEYDRIWRVDHHLEAALQAARTARAHAGHVPYQGQNVGRLRRVERRLGDEQGAMSTQVFHVEGEMYRRWGRAGGQDFGEWIRPLRNEARDEGRAAARGEAD